MPRKRARSSSSCSSSEDDGIVENPSRASTPDVTNGTQPAQQAVTKEERFNARYKTDQHTNEEVLGEYISVYIATRR